MKTIVLDGPKSYDPAPVGQHRAVLAEIEQRAFPSKFGNASSRETLIFRFELDPATAGVRQDGRRWVVSKLTGLSLGKKSKLRELLESWEGREIADADLIGYPITDRLIGRSANLAVRHMTKPDGKVVAEIGYISPAPKGEGLAVSDGFEYAISAEEPDDDEA